MLAYRHCYDLAYTSTQEAYRFDRAVGIGALLGEGDRIIRLQNLQRKWERALFIPADNKVDER